jgi:hypothetical protein
MEMKLRKLLPLVGALCLGLTSSVFANSNYQNGSGSSTYGSSTDSSSSQGNYQRGTFREITPNAGPRVAHGADVFLTADFIWWKVSEEGLTFSSTGVAGDNTPQASKGKAASVGEDWAPGFKVGLGLNLGHDGWDLYTQYTWLHASDSKTQSGVFVFVPEILPFGDGPTIVGTSAKGSWDTHLNVIDLELGRNFYVSQYLTMRPFFGLKGTWQSHSFKNTVNSDSISIGGNNNNPFAGSVTNSKKYDFWGIGVRGGLQTGWYFTKCWSIYGNLALTSLWTNYHKDTQTVNVSNSTDGTQTLVVNIDNDNSYTSRFISELELGLRWETWFYDDNYHFAIQAGWEQQNWINLSHFSEILDYSRADFSTQGLNLKFRFDF